MFIDIDRRKIYYVFQAKYFTMIEQQAAFLKNDGSIVGTDISY